MPWVQSLGKNYIYFSSDEWFIKNQVDIWHAFGLQRHSSSVPALCIHQHFVKWPKCWYWGRERIKLSIAMLALVMSSSTREFFHRSNIKNGRWCLQYDYYTLWQVDHDQYWQMCRLIEHKLWVHLCIVCSIIFHKLAKFR